MADTALTGLSAFTPDAADLLYGVDDPSGTPVSKKATVGSLAAALIRSGSYASLPAAGYAGRLYLPTDAPYAYLRDTGSGWDHFLPGGLGLATLPVNGDFSWVNQGSATVSTTNGGIYLQGPAGASVNMRIRKKAAPATPYTVTAALLPVSIASQRVGIGFRQSSDGKCATIEVVTDSTSARVTNSKWNSATSFSAAYLGPTGVHLGTPIFFRIADNGANRICSYSVDGQNFVVFHTIGRTDFLTADEVLFFVHDTSNAYNTAMTLLSWKEA
jgi:hypothetical protein